MQLVGLLKFDWDQAHVKRPVTCKGNKQLLFYGWASWGYRFRKSTNSVATVGGISSCVCVCAWNGGGGMGFTIQLIFETDRQSCLDRNSISQIPLVTGKIRRPVQLVYLVIFDRTKIIYARRTGETSLNSAGSVILWYRFVYAFPKWYIHNLFWLVKWDGFEVVKLSCWIMWDRRKQRFFNKVCCDMRDI